MSDICYGPAGGCPICYGPHHFGQTCAEAEAERQQAREAKRRKAHPTVVELPQCEKCGAFAVAEGLPNKPCLKCGHHAAPSAEGKTE